MRARGKAIGRVEKCSPMCCCKYAYVVLSLRLSASAPVRNAKPPNGAKKQTESRAFSGGAIRPLSLRKYCPDDRMTWGMWHLPLKGQHLVLFTVFRYRLCRRWKISVESARSLFLKRCWYAKKINQKRLANVNKLLKQTPFQPRAYVEKNEEKLCRMHRDLRCKIDCEIWRRKKSFLRHGK